MLTKLNDINQTWTLFIDRDGVVNEEKQGDYIHHWNEFKFYSHAKEAFAKFNRIFGTIVMVTNQRGVARGLTRMEDLNTIHANMLDEIQKAGGRIDKIYVCTDLESENRKPNPGMGLMALNDFPQIRLNKSVMIGNSISDMDFGRNLGVAINIFLSTTHKDTYLNDTKIDLVFDDLISVANALSVR